jgi:hypothetical protein
MCRYQTGTAQSTTNAGTPNIQNFNIINQSEFPRMETVSTPYSNQGLNQKSKSVKNFMAPTAANINKLENSQSQMLGSYISRVSTRDQTTRFTKTPD